MDGLPVPGAQGLPTRLTRFFGRQAEASELRGLFNVVRRLETLRVDVEPGVGRR
ncbi:MAG: hypothetical protein ACRD07_13305 [Acidimicrobiales bacterium]